MTTRGQLEVRLANARIALEMDLNQLEEIKEELHHIATHTPTPQQKQPQLDPADQVRRKKLKAAIPMVQANIQTMKDEIKELENQLQHLKEAE